VSCCCPCRGVTGLQIFRALRQSAPGTICRPESWALLRPASVAISVARLETKNDTRGASETLAGPFNAHWKGAAVVAASDYPLALGKGMGECHRLMPSRPIFGHMHDWVGPGMPAAAVFFDGLNSTRMPLLRAPLRLTISNPACKPRPAISPTTPSLPTSRRFNRFAVLHDGKQ
jgi:hypothetical protein